jgi:uncharacterized protein (TIGR02453 family)
MSAKKSAFTQETFRFFRELAWNNHKEWMDANRARYRAHVVEPLRALLDQLGPAVLRLNPHFDVSGRTGTNFSRINRDVRFAADKSPYRTQMYVMFVDERAKEGDPSASLRAGDGQLYTGISPDAITAGFRIYGNRNSRLGKVAAPRAMQNAKWLAQQARRLSRKYESYWYSMEKGEWTKRGGWPTKPEDWKRLKGWIVRRKMKPAAATRITFAKEVAAIFRELFPLYRFTSSPDWKA